MADFCWQCCETVLGIRGEQNDFNGFVEFKSEGVTASVLCEGCGPTVVDQEGKCINPNCKEHGGALVIEDEKKGGNGRSIGNPCRGGEDGSCEK